MIRFLCVLVIRTLPGGVWFLGEPAVGVFRGRAPFGRLTVEMAQAFPFGGEVTLSTVLGFRV